MNEFENTGVETTTEAATNEEQTVKTYTADEVAKLLQQETDRRVSQALAKQQKKHEKQMSLSKLDGDEREKALKDETIAELREQLAAFQVEKNRSELKSVLSSRGLSAEFADIIAIGDDIEEAQANIDALDRLFKAAVKAEVEKRLAGTTPRGNGAANVEITKEAAKNMGLAEMNRLAKTNPDLYKKLFN